MKSEKGGRDEVYPRSHPRMGGHIAVIDMLIIG
jgi:hypothetical protein